MQNINCIMECK